MRLPCTILSIAAGAAGLAAALFAVGPSLAGGEDSPWVGRRLSVDGATVAVDLLPDDASAAGPLLRLGVDALRATRAYLGPAAAPRRVAIVAWPRDRQLPAGAPAGLRVEPGFRADTPGAAERIAVDVVRRAFADGDGAAPAAGPVPSMALYVATHRLGLETIDALAARRRWRRIVDLASRTGDPSAGAVERGALLLHHLRLAAGDGPFDAAMHALATGPAPRSWPVVVAAIETAAHRDLGWLARPWVEGDVVPFLGLAAADWRRRDPDGSGVLAVTVRSQPSLPQRLVVRVVDRDGRTVSSTAWLAGGETAVVVRLAAPPALLTVDPSAEMLRRLDPAERPPLIGEALARDAGLVVVGSGRGERWRDAVRALVATAPLLETAATVRVDRQIEVGALDAALRVIALGVPRGDIAGPLRERLARAGVRLGDERYRFAGRTVRGPRTGLAVALPAATAGEPPVLVLDAPSPETLRVMLDRLPALAAESFALFEDGRLVAAGVLPAGQGPL